MTKIIYLLLLQLKMDINLRIIIDKVDSILRIECEDVQLKDLWLLDVKDDKVADITNKLVENVGDLKNNILQEALTTEKDFQLKIYKNEQDIVIQVDFKFAKQIKSFYLYLKKLSRDRINVIESIINDLKQEIINLKTQNNYLENRIISLEQLEILVINDWTIKRCGKVVQIHKVGVSNTSNSEILQFTLPNHLRPSLSLWILAYCCGALSSMITITSDGNFYLNSNLDLPSPRGITCVYILD